MEPQIRYLRAPDGVTIAYYEMGEGQPFVWIDLPYSHLQVERQDASTDGALGAVASQARLVRFDHRGFGLSDRNPADFSLDAMVSDLEAVVDRLDLPPFVLYASRGPTTPIAVTYAVRHPERLTNMVLFNASSRMPSKMQEQMGNLLAAAPDWTFASEGMSRLVQGWEDEAASRSISELLRAAIDMDGFKRWFAEYATWDVQDLLPQVRTRTVLTNNLGHPWFGEEHGRAMAADMPDAQCFINDGKTSIERNRKTFIAIRDFLGVPEVSVPQSIAPSPSQAQGPSGTAIILFADIVDSTALTERLGDSAFRDKARDLDSALRAIIRDHSGTAIEGKLLGDGVLGVFTSARHAIDAALACGAAGESGGLPLHLGLHAGDVIREDDNVFGGAVNIAARISGLSAPGEVLVSDTVRSLARTSSGVSFDDRGEHALKGVAEPVRVYRASLGD